MTDLLGFKAHERLRVEWVVFYYTAGKENATLTAKHFAISRKTFHKWFKRFKDSKYNVQSLATQSNPPFHKRNWKVTLTQEERIRRLRKRYPHYGKSKLKVLYEKEYSEGSLLLYLINQPIENLQTDNGSEFAWEFERATAKLGIQRYFSRVKTPPHQSLGYLATQSILKKSLLKSVAHCYLCGQPAQRID